MLGERLLWQMKCDSTPESFTRLIRQSIVEQDKAKALAGVMGLNECGMGATKQTELILDCAKKADHKQAARLARTHLSAKGALSSDNNFICQAAWMLAGGTSPVADAAYPVSFGEVIELREKALEKWKHPEPIPGWCCDGVHSAGNDVRFMGAWHHMYAVCRVFQHYGRVDPADQWLPEFQCYDGLTIELGPSEPEEDTVQLDCTT
jgi:hypothetical protein